MTDSASMLLHAISAVGVQHPTQPDLQEVEPFRHFFTDAGDLNRDDLDRRDGACTRRELLARYLLLSAVLDQGPDIQGVRALLTQVTSDLYFNEVRFLHQPTAFFSDLGLAVDQILSRHEGIKRLRAEDWATANQSRASRYNLFMDSSTQALCYAVFRWGAPLAVPLMLCNDLRDGHEDGQASALIDFLETWPSSEIMSRQVKEHQRYGLGKAIGDKACHLFAKWLVSSYGLSRRDTPAWEHLSYELPLDSNAGRVLWRTGYLLGLASLEDYKKYQVIQPQAGKKGEDYIRVTNLREKAATHMLPSDVRDAYVEVVSTCLCTRRRPRKVMINEVQHAYLYAMYDDYGYSVANLDDGLIYIGTTWCLNHDSPMCDVCEIGHLCEGKQMNAYLISHYRT